MLLTINRIRDDGEATLGLLYVDGKPFCFTLEDQSQEEKLAAETRIASGVYEIGRRQYGMFYEAYYERWGHDFVPEVLGVPDFTDILIHTGNTDDQTEGCILVGLTADMSRTATIGKSRLAYAHLYNIISRAFYQGDVVELEIIDEGET
jgi:hypothetical protein